MEVHYSIITGATNPILRSVADPIENFTEDIKQLALDMKLVCHEEDGVGLAAPQIGLSVRIIYTSQWKNTPKGLKFLSDQIMINPHITAKSTTMNKDVEWCLSLPGIEWLVKRYDWIKVKFQDATGKKLTKTYKKYKTRIIQHEIDHLDGILFIDKLVKSKEKIKI